jgi:hypothetical protein
MAEISNSASPPNPSTTPAAEISAPRGEIVTREFIKEIDEWIAQLYECKQLTEQQVKILCDKVFTNKTTKIIASFRLERF